MDGKFRQTPSDFLENYQACVLVVNKENFMDFLRNGIIIKC